MDCPIELIKDLKEMEKQLNRLNSHLAAEIDGVLERWECLGRAGGQREDHAAALLGCLNYHLKDISNFCLNCHEQIEAVKKNPFGRDDK